MSAKALVDAVVYLLENASPPPPAILLNEVLKLQDEPAVQKAPQLPTDTGGAG